MFDWSVTANALRRPGQIITGGSPTIIIDGIVPPLLSDPKVAIQTGIDRDGSFVTLTP
jgi:hypothetical protein